MTARLRWRVPPTGLKAVRETDGFFLEQVKLENEPGRQKGVFGRYWEVSYKLSRSDGRQEWFQEHGVQVEPSPGFETIDDIDSLVEAAHQVQPNLLLVNRCLLDIQTIEQLVDDLDCPLGLVS